MILTPSLSVHLLEARIHHNLIDEGTKHLCRLIICSSSEHSEKEKNRAAEILVQHFGYQADYIDSFRHKEE